MTSLYYPLIAFFVALVLVFWIHPKILRIAIEKNLVDHPDARKLQKNSVPVLGGIVVFFGVVIAMFFMSRVIDSDLFLPILVSMMVMLYVGCIDDFVNLTPALRFAIEIVVILMLIKFCGHSINDLHGLWNIYTINNWIAIPLTIFICVGIINAINLIDGINGLSSGYCIFACSVFCYVFYRAGDTTMMIFSAACCGALIPFFLHNVFGNKTRMFLGDGGALVMGLNMAGFVVGVLKNNSPISLQAAPNIGLVPFSLAVLAMPVFDTVRVMMMRIVKKKSPFHPDKTHLHHVLLGMGCSHLTVTLTILSINILIVLVWYLLARLGLSIDMQTYAVIFMGIFSTVGLYVFLFYQERHNAWWFRSTSHFIKKHSISQRPWFLALSKLVDRW